MPGHRLDEFTARVLRLIAEDSPVRFVTLGTQVWPERVPADWWLLLESAVTDLAERGLVYYKLGLYQGNAESSSAGGLLSAREEILTVRCSSDGFTAAGFPRRRHFVGEQLLQHMPRDFIRPTKDAIWVDWTRFWHHPFAAMGGPIEREPLRTHRLHYPLHLHDRDWDHEEGYDMMSSHERPQRRGIPTDPAKLEEARRLLGEGKSYKEAAAAVGISPYTLYGHIPAGNPTSLRAAQVRLERQGKRPKANGSEEPQADLLASEQRVVVKIPAEVVPQLSQATQAAVIAGQLQTENLQQRAESLKQRMLKVVAEHGPFAGLEDLMLMVERSGDEHDKRYFDKHKSFHILNDLNRAGLVRYNENSGRSHTGKRTAFNIRATDAGLRAAGVLRPVPVRAKGEVRGDLTNARNQPVVAPGGPIERVRVLDIHAHDPEVWMSTCRACMVYHPTGRAHAAANRKAEEPGAAPLASEPVEKELESPQEELAVGASPELIAAMGAVLANYPLLDGLLDREAAKVAATERATKYLEAAALLEAIDPAESQRMMALAQVAEGEPFTPLEAEYLAYAKNRSQT